MKTLLNTTSVERRGSRVKRGLNRPGLNRCTIRTIGNRKNCEKYVVSFLWARNKTRRGARVALLAVSILQRSRQTADSRPWYETTAAPRRLAVTDREYRSQCIRGHIACLETRFVSFPRPPTTNLHCNPLNHFNMAASTGARTASSDISPSLPPEYSDRPAIFSLHYVYSA